MNLMASVRLFLTTVTMAVVFFLALSEPSFAAGIETVLENIVNMFQGNTLRLVAIIAVIIVGVAWMFGYLDLRKAAYCVLGIGIAFGAKEIVNTIAGGS